ncbi:MAG: trypsin-like peptidase domain-containing protein [Erysipelotrichaceae bacterium]
MEENKELQDDCIIDAQIIDQQSETQSINESTSPLHKDPIVRNKRKKKGHPFIYAVFIAFLAFGCAFSGTYLAIEITQYNKIVLYESVDTTTTLNVTDSGLSLQEVVNLTSPSVVEILTENVSEYMNQSYIQTGAGSGVIITSDGYIVTNNHVIEDVNNIQVKLTDGTTYTATLIGTDSTTDIAVIKIDATGLTPAVFADSSQIQVGDSVIAIGNPLGELGGSVTDGIISALDREISVEGQSMTLIQTNAQVSPGNSGGGLFNTSAELVGIVVAKSSDEYAEGIGFVIPSNVVKEIVEELINYGYVTTRPTLGIYLQEITANSQGIKEGVYVVEVIEGTAAEDAGLQPNDRIIAVDNQEVTTYDELSAIISSKEVGDQVTIQVSRDGKIVELTCTLQNSLNTN